jgi:elongation of very long chain fatty acids protein 6
MLDTKEYVFRGAKFTQFFQNVPAFEPFYTDFEKNYDVETILEWTKHNWWLPITAVTLYLCWCFFSQKIMQNYERFDLRYPLAYWNLFLALFSTYGAFRCIPHFIWNVTHYSFDKTVCLHPTLEMAWGCGATGLAVQLFIFSKLPELIDTVFITLRKRDLLFLHWYHHFTVLLFCWISYATESGAGFYFVTMNYTVHAIMYFYYYLMAIKKVPTWFPAQIITVLQISQMVVGMYVVAAGAYFKLYGSANFAPGECQNDMTNMIAGVVMYGSYFILFMQFALARYYFKKPALGAKAKKAN